MRTSLMDFTRGSQVAETVTMMFGTALRPMFWTTLAIIVGMVSWLLWKHGQPGDSYYWLMHVYASSWTWMSFSPDHLIGLRTATEGTVMVRVGSVNTYPPLIAAWDRFWTSIIDGSIYGLMLGIPLAVVSTIALRRYGHGLTTRRHKRGSQLVTQPELIAEITTYNEVTGRDDRAADAARILAHVPPLERPLVRRSTLIASGMYEPYRLAGIPYPWRAEQTHTMLVGTTGTGKSTVMKNLLDQIRARGGRAVVFDLTGTYVESFYNPRTDIILNPFDHRCPKWSPFSDAHTREHFKEASLALVPMSDGGGDSFWQDSARMLFVETCVRLMEQGRGTSEALSDVLMTSKLKDLHAHLLRTVAAALTDPEAKRMAESIRATFNTYAQALHTLPTEGRPFSVRDWVLESDGTWDDEGNHEPPRSSVLFIAAQHVNLRSVRVLLTLWLTTAINTLMSMGGDKRDIRMWFLLDEINALHNIPALVSGMQTARNYGGAFVLGVHTMHQLIETYGENLAETIASLAKTKLMMNTRDEGTQKWASAQVGEGEWTEMEENLSYGVSNVRDAATLQRKVKLEPLVIPSQFQELPDLTGYIKFPQGMPAALVRVDYVRYTKPNRGFIERKIAPLAPPPAPPLALPHYVINGVKVTRDGEIVEDTATSAPAVTGAASVAAIIDDEGYQTAPTPPERIPAGGADGPPVDLIDIRGNGDRNDIAIEHGQRTLPGEGGGAGVAPGPRGGPRDNGLGEPAAPEKADTRTTGVALQEQRQSFGEEDRAKRHHDRSLGNNIPAHHIPRDAEPEPVVDDSWGRGA